MPEGSKVFPRFTVLENLQIGGYTRAKVSLGPELDFVFEMFPRLKERQKQYAGTLSGGEQQMLAIGRALMAKPKLCCSTNRPWDLAPKIVEQILENIRAINRAGVTVLLVEQNAAMALAISHRGYVLETGAVILEGNGQGACRQRSGASGVSWADEDKRVRRSLKDRRRTVKLKDAVQYRTRQISFGPAAR